jgi:hypothetical protein
MRVIGITMKHSSRRRFADDQDMQLVRAAASALPAVVALLLWRRRPG